LRYELTETWHFGLGGGLAFVTAAVVTTVNQTAKKSFRATVR
jgi:hypothetical protein